MEAMSEIEIEGAAQPAPHYRVRRTPLTWVRDGGLTTFLFLLPLLLIFGAFSWYPIVRTFVMAFQHTNLVAGADLGRLRQLPRRPRTIRRFRSPSRTPCTSPCSRSSSAIRFRSSPPC